MDKKVICCELGKVVRLGGAYWKNVSPTLIASYTDNQPPFIVEDVSIYSMANCDHTLTLYGVNVAPTLTSRMGTVGNQVPVFVEKDTLTPWDVQSNRIVSENGKANALYGGVGQGTHNGAVMQSVYSFDSMASNSMKSKNPNSGCREVDVAKTVDATDPNPSKNQGGIAIVDTYAVAQNQRGELRIDTDKAYALTATEGSRPGQSKPCVVDSFCIAGNTIDRKIENGGNGAGFQKDVSYTLNTIDRHAVNDVSPEKVGTLAAADGKGKNGQDINKFPIVESRIRRECERLQGLPDDYTNIPSVDKHGKEKPASDASRYKAIGNGMAQPCADFVIKQIAYYSKEQP